MNHKVLAFPHVGNDVQVLPQPNALPKKEAQRLAQSLFNTGDFKFTQVVEVVLTVKSHELKKAEHAMAFVNTLPLDPTYDS